MFMLKLLPKPLFVGLLMTLSVSQSASAEVKLYQYDGKMPFAQMMLSMMVAMGVLDRIPTHGPYAGYGLRGTQLNSPWSSYSNPYARALALRGYNPGSSYLGSSYLGNLYGNNYNVNNPFVRSPWLQTPWSASAFGHSPYTSSLWGTPNWGVLPYDSYSPYDVVGGSQWDTPHWSQSELDGWIDEPWSNESWETSSWNPDAADYRSEHRPRTAVSQTAPLIQNFNYGPPQNQQVQGKQQARGTQQSQGNQQAYNRSPLSKIAPPNHPPRRLSQSQQPRQQQPQQQQPQQQSAQQQKRTSPLHKRMGQNYNDGYATPRKKSNKKEYAGPACVTEFCGLKKPDMNGLWVAENGEMLGINKERYLWSDGRSRYLTGYMKIQNEYLLANVDDNDQLLRFKYKLAGNHLMTLRPDGTIREFIRVPTDQLPAYGVQRDGYPIDGYPVDGYQADSYPPAGYPPAGYPPGVHPGDIYSGVPYGDMYGGDIYGPYDNLANDPYSEQYGGQYGGQYDGQSDGQWESLDYSPPE